MKGDFSRETFDPTKHYTAVLMQQGRVQLDADWNEQQALNQYREETEAIDVIGACGAPKNHAGFEITSDGKTLLISAGRYYVDGILCQNDVDQLRYEAQDKGDLPGASVGALQEAFKKAGATAGIVYLDVWKRHITFREDGLILEKALGEPDTTTRIETVWQVRVLPMPPGRNKDRLAELAKRSKALKAQLKQAKTVQASFKNEITAFEGQLDALPAAAPGRTALAAALEEITVQAAAAAEAEAELAKELDVVTERARRLSRDTPLTCDDLPDLPRLSTGQLTARTQAPSNQNDPCLPPPGTGYRRLENQLYRVEVHEPGAQGTATFKWSRDNGTVVTTIEKIAGNTIVVHDLGRDEMLGFAAGDWVEITDDALELNGLPGQLAQINPPNAATRQITLLNATPAPLDPGPDGVDPARHPKLRRWDQVDQPAAPTDQHGIKTAGGFLPLEDGVEVEFGPGDYRSGDYWVIPARTAIGDVEWPPFAVPNVAPLPSPARGIEHHYCRLATVDFDDGEWDVTGDCREIFCPLTEVACAVHTALHVTGTSWANDDFVRFAEDGGLELRITLDAAPDAASISDASVWVTVDVPYAADGGAATPGAFQTITIDGQVGIDNSDKRVIVWRYTPPAAGPQSPHLSLRGLATSAAAGGGEGAGTGRRRRRAPVSTMAVGRPAIEPRVRVTLKGHVIWREEGRAHDRRHLDGQALGHRGLRSDHETPRTALTFPSGAGAAASDFESWFYVGGGRQQAEPLQVTTVAFRGANEQLSSAGTVGVPLGNTNVTFKAGEEMRSVDIAFNRPNVAVDQPVDVSHSVIVQRTNADGVTATVTGHIAQTDARTVRFVLGGTQAGPPPTFSRGNYRLTVLGDPDPATGAAPIRALDDQSALDGDFHDEPGGNFVLPFNVT